MIFLFYSVWERMLAPSRQWRVTRLSRVLSMCGMCLGRTASSLGRLSYFLTESPEDEVVKKKRGIERHPNTQAPLEARKGFLFFLPGALSTAIAFSRKAGYVRNRLKYR